MAFQQGLSGLSSASQQLDVISNNISNASNVGFKQAGAQFSDVYAASLSGVAGGNQVGIGTAVGRVQQLFSQGNITATSNPLDLAINGNGFFELESADGKDIAYSRNGQFESDKNGYIINSSGYRLCGYTAESPSTTVPLNTNVATALMGSPKTTDEVSLGLNMNSKAATVSFADPNNPTTAELTNTNVFSSPVSVYDSKGGSHVVTLYFAKESSISSTDWQVYSSVDGGAATGPVGAMTYSTAGSLTGGSPLNLTITPPAGANYTIGDAASQISFDFTGSTEYGQSFNTTKLSQNGYEEGQLSNITISKEGLIEARYSNGQKSALGTIALTTFANQNGLASVGNNMWTATYESGDPLPDKPGMGGRGAIQSSSVEDSNVDLTTELVNLITAQRNYQANSQSIKTQDSVMQTLVSLR